MGQLTLQLMGCFLVAALSTQQVFGSQPCMPKHYGTDNIVCVCNATYCDTIDEIIQPSRGQYLRYTSNKAGLRFEKTISYFDRNNKPGSVQISIDANLKYQTIYGFGTAFTDAVGINVNSLSLGSQENLLKSYFSPEGIELNFGRVPIAGSDFSTHTYTYDDVTNDSRLKHFNLTSEDFNYKIPLLKRVLAMSKRNVRLLGAAWSAPPWMKTNKDYSGFGFLMEEYYDAWAEYHIRFLDEYKARGLEFWSLSTGNEPSNGIIPVNRFNSLGWTPFTQMKWVREHLGPTLRRSQHNKTKIIAVDDQRFMLPWWINSLRSDHITSQYVDGIGVHWYWDTIFPPMLLDMTHENFPDKFILATEACVGDKPWDFQKVMLGSWERGELYMDDIIQDLHHWVVGWVDWNLVLDTRGGPNWANNFVDSAIIANASGDVFYKQPMFYALGHFAKFVPEGSVRIAVTPKSKRGIESIAFQTPDNGIVIVLHNKKSWDQSVTISDPTRGNINLLLSKRSFETIVFW